MIRKMLYLPVICLALSVLLSQTVLAQTATTITASKVSEAALDAYSARVRKIVFARWKLPIVERTTIVRVETTVSPDGKASESKIFVSPTLPNDAEVKRSVGVILENTAFPTPPGDGPVAVEFKLLAQIGPLLSSCSPLTVYVPETLADRTGEVIPRSSLEGMVQAITRWNQAAGDKKTAVIVPVSDPTRAAVRIEAYEDMPAFGPYLTDNATGQTVVRVALKRPVAGAVSGGFRSYQPDRVAQQTMFQLGRLLGLAPSAERNNILSPAFSDMDMRVRTPNSSTKNVQVYMGRSADGSFQSRQGGSSPRGSSGSLESNTIDDDSEYPLEERTISASQLEQVLKQGRSNSCAI